MLNCIHCSKQILQTKGSTGKYCSNACQRARISEQKLRAWLNDNEKVGKTIVKRYLAESCGDKCNECGISEWLSSPLVLEIDHVDGDAYNNRPENLRLLCPNCHAQTPTYKNRNKGNGRAANKGKGWLLQ
jgi:hypothetical protein